MMSATRLYGKELIFIGERNGVSSDELHELLAGVGVGVAFAADECFACAMGSMDITTQLGVKMAAERCGSGGYAVVLGASGADETKVYVETLTTGDPFGLGPLAGCALHAEVYSIFDPETASIVPEVMREKIINARARKGELDKINDLVRSTRSM